MTTFEIHEFSTIFPGLSEDDQAALTASIEQVGQQEPIEVWRGKVVDGRHRYLACQELGIEPIVSYIDNETPEITVFERVLAKNLRRRHLSASQRAAMAATLAETYQAVIGRANAAAEPADDEDNEDEFVGQEPVKEPDAAGKAPEVSPGFIDEDKQPSSPPPTQSESSTKAIEKAADQMSVSRTYALKAKTLKSEAPDLHKALEDGEMTMPEAWGIFEDRRAGANEDLTMQKLEAWEADNTIPTRLLEAIRGGVVLAKPKEREKFASLDPAVAEMITHVIEAGWPVDKSVRLLKAGVDETMQLRDLIAKFQFDSLRKTTVADGYMVNGFLITIKPPAKKS